jgi:1-acyl-sn-glycerol-3-phosphate acyltransferase
MTDKDREPKEMGNQRLSLSDQILAAPLRCVKGATLWSSVALGTAIFGSTTLLTSVFFIGKSNRRPLHFIGVKWAKSILTLNPWWSFTICGKENLPQDGQPVVFVSNHLSQTDILAVYSIGMDFRWLSKESVFKVPILGWAMSAVGYVPVSRGDRASHRRAMQLSKAHLARGTPMLFFPEGTRSPDGRIQPFKIGAFSLAKAANVPIVPITLVGTESLLPKGSFVPGFADVTITVHPALNWLDGEDATSMMNRTFACMNDALPPQMRFAEKRSQEIEV